MTAEQIAAMRSKIAELTAADEHLCAMDFGPDILRLVDEREALLAALRGVLDQKHPALIFAARQAARVAIAKAEAP